MKVDVILQLTFDVKDAGKDCDSPECDDVVQKVEDRLGNLMRVVDAEGGFVNDIKLHDDPLPMKKTIFPLF